MTKDEILKVFERARNEARDKYRVEIKGFFGSYARGEENTESDLDVLVEFREGATLFNLTGLGNFLEEMLHCKVDVVSKRAVRKEIAPPYLRRSNQLMKRDYRLFLQDILDACKHILPTSPGKIWRACGTG